MMRELITAAAAAGIIGCTPRQIARLADAGRLKPAEKLPGLRGAYLFERATVERYADARGQVTR